MSPLKKKPMVTMAKDKLDGAIAKAVTTALQEQQGDLNSLTCSAVKEAVNGILIPLLADLQRQIQHTQANVDVLAKGIALSQKGIQNYSAKFDTLQATMRASKKKPS